MSRSTRSVLAVVAVLVVAGLGYAIRERFFSRAAQLAAIHEACLADIASGQAKAKAALPGPDTPLREWSGALGRLIDEVAGGMSSAACRALRESCRLDWDGELCRRARARYGT